MTKKKNSWQKKLSLYKFTQQFVALTSPRSLDKFLLSKKIMSKKKKKDKKNYDKKKKIILDKKNYPSTK